MIVYFTQRLLLDEQIIICVYGSGLGLSPHPVGIDHTHKSQSGEVAQGRLLCICVHSGLCAKAWLSSCPIVVPGPQG